MKCELCKREVKKLNSLCITEWVHYPRSVIGYYPHLVPIGDFCEECTLGNIDKEESLSEIV